MARQLKTPILKRKKKQAAHHDTKIVRIFNLVGFHTGQNCPSERQNCPFQIMRNGPIEKWKFEMTEVSFN